MCRDVPAVDILNLIGRGQQRCDLWLPVLWQLVNCPRALGLIGCGRQVTVGCVEEERQLERR